MSKILYRTITLFLVLCFSITAMLYLFFDVQQFRYNVAGHEQVNKLRHLQTVKLPLGKFKETNNTDEVWINGALYDISSYTIVNDTVIISAFHDVAEEGIINSIVDSFEPDSKYSSYDNTAKVSKHPIRYPVDDKLIVLPYTLSVIHANVSPDWFVHDVKFSFGLFCTITSPPPRQAFA